MQEATALDTPATVDAQISVEEVLAAAYAQRSAEIEAKGEDDRKIADVLDKHARSIILLLGMSACPNCLANRLARVIDVSSHKVLGAFSDRGWRTYEAGHGQNKHTDNRKAIGV